MFVYLIQVQTAENINKIAGPGMDKWTPPSRGIVNQTPEWFTIPDSSSSVCDCPIPIVAFSLLLLSSFPPPLNLKTSGIDSCSTPAVQACTHRF